jgi:hypothetical protein
MRSGSAATRSGAFSRSDPARQRPPPDWDEVIARCQRGESTVAIAADLGTTHSGVRHVLMSAGDPAPSAWSVPAIAPSYLCRQWRARPCEMSTVARTFPRA